MMIYTGGRHISNRQELPATHIHPHKKIQYDQITPKL